MLSFLWSNNHVASHSIESYICHLKLKFGSCLSWTTNILKGGSERVKVAVGWCYDLVRLTSLGFPFGLNIGWLTYIKWVHTLESDKIRLWVVKHTRPECRVTSLRRSLIQKLNHRSESHHHTRLLFPLLTSTRLSDSTNMQSPRCITKSEIDAFAPPPRQKYLMKVSDQLKWQLIDKRAVQDFD